MSSPRETTFYVNSTKRSIVLTGMAADRFYSMSVRAYRRVDKDINEKGVIYSVLTPAKSQRYQPTSTVAFAGDIVGTIQGVESSVVIADLDAITSDNMLSRGEKPALLTTYNQISASYTASIAKGQQLGGVDTPRNAAIAAKKALDDYLATLSPAWNDLGEDTPIDQVAFQTAFASMAATQADLDAALTERASRSSTWEGVSGTGKPQDDATKGAPDGTMVGNQKAEDVAKSVSTLKDGGFLDTTAPGIPLDLKLTSTLTDAGVTLAASWTARTESDLAGYVIAVREGSGALNEYPCTKNAYEWTALKRNTAYSAQVASVDKAGNRSSFSNFVTLTTARDTVAPAVATALKATSAYTNIFLSWTNPNDADLAAVQVWWAATNDSSKATLISTENQRPQTGGTYTHSGLKSGSSNYYWLKAVDTSGNASGFSVGSGLVKTTLVDISDVAPAVNQGLTGTVTGLPDPNGYTGSKLVLNSIDEKLYRYVDGKWSAAVSPLDFDELVTEDLIDTRGLDILTPGGETMFGSNGFIGPGANINLNNSNVLLSTIAANALVPSLNFVGEFATAPDEALLRDSWRQNAVYKNTQDGHSYVLTGDPLGWEIYLSDGQSFTVTIESTNGTVFRVGQARSTLLKARLFKNGAEVTDSVPDSWFRWRRVSGFPQPAPNDDATFNAQYSRGFKQISISIDQVQARATFFVDVIN